MEDHLSIRMDSIIAEKEVVNNLREILITVMLCTNTYAVIGLMHGLHTVLCVCECVSHLAVSDFLQICGL